MGKDWPVQSLLIYLSFVVTVNATIDLYIAQEEVQRILGFKGDLFYIRDGEANRNAVNYQLLIPENTDHIALTWHDKRDFSVVPTRYHANINASDNGVLANVNTSLPSAGNVPTREEEVFYVNMTCKPNTDGSALVNFYLDMMMYTLEEIGQSKYHLVFNFNKMCKDEIIQTDEETNVVPKDDKYSGNGGKIDKTAMFYIAVGITCSIILVIATAVAYLHVRSMPKTKEDGTIDGNITNANEAPLPHLKSASIPQAVRMVRAEQQLKEMLINLKDFSVRRTLLSIGNTMQEGSFGRMYVGTLISAESGEEFKVSVKTVTDNASPDQIVLFLAEASQLKRTTHHNVLPIMHVCCEGNIPLVIYHYMNRGNLKNYLRLSRTVEPLSRPMTTRDIVNIALQVARGLHYLSRRRLTHKDVATRNCVVDEELHVKVCDNALSRDFFPGDYHCLGENENRPVRWMAVESLESNEYSPASDVWSYGVLLWELCSLAQTPYASVDPFEMLSYLQSGLRLPQPANCPDDFFTVMACCWALSSDERPHFQQIIACLEAFISKLNAFI